MTATHNPKRKSQILPTEKKIANLLKTKMNSINKLNTLLISTRATSPSENQLSFLAPSKKLMLPSTLGNKSSMKTPPPILSCSGLSLSAATLNLIPSMNMFFRSGATKGSNTSNKFDSKLEKNKKPSLRWPLRYHQSNKTTTSTESSKFSLKTFSQSVSQ